MHEERPRRPTVNLYTRPASLADARLFGSLLVRAFANDPMYYWLYHWPARDSPERAAAIEHTQQIRLPGDKRLLVSNNIHWFIAADRNTGEAIGASGWLIPNSDNARHHLRKLTFYEWIAHLAYKLYDAVVNNGVACKLYALFHPDSLGRLQRGRRLRVEAERSFKPLIRSAHKEAGFWQLAFLCVVPEYAGRGVGTSMLRWGLDKADQDDRAIYITASPAGASVYEKAGFKTIFSEVVFQGEKGGPVPLCTLYRPSKSEREQGKSQA